MRQEVPTRKLKLEAGIPEDIKLCTARLQAYLQINLFFMHVKYKGTFKKVTNPVWKCHCTQRYWSTSLLIQKLF